VRTLIVLLIFLSAMPDTMAAPVVKELFMDRYGASPSMAQMFNGINLFGAFAALPLLWFVRGKNHSVALVIWGCVLTCSDGAATWIGMDTRCACA
jgi:hypothetical protein